MEHKSEIQNLTSKKSSDDRYLHKSQNLSTHTAIQKQLSTNNNNRYKNSEEKGGYDNQSKYLQLTPEQELTAKSAQKLKKILGRLTEPLIIKGKDGQDYKIWPTVSKEQAEQVEKQTGIVPRSEGNKISGCLGSGAFGECYVAEVIGKHTFCGIKVITGRVLESQQEAKIQMMLTQGLDPKQTHLMPITDIIEVYNQRGTLERLYYVMPLAALGNVNSLRKFLRQLENPELKYLIQLHIAQGLLLGLQHMHRMNTFHLDVKLQNLVVNNDGTVLIIDFGCAEKVEVVNGQALLIAREDEAIPERFIGNGDPKYFSPERQEAEQKGQAFDCIQSDLYSAGLALWELYTGESVKHYRRNNPNKSFLEHSALCNIEENSLGHLINKLIEPNSRYRFELDNSLNHLAFKEPNFHNKEVMEGVLNYLKAFAQRFQLLRNPTIFGGSIKIVVVGDDKYEKTKLLYTFREGPQLGYQKTVHDNHTVFEKFHFNGRYHKLDLWDTHGQEEYDRLRPLSYSATDVFVLVSSVISPSTFVNASTKWFPELRHHCPDASILLVGTQIELRDKVKDVNIDIISYEQGVQKAKEIGAVKYMECSTKTGIGVREVFKQAVLSVIEKNEKQEQKTKSPFKIAKQWLQNRDNIFNKNQAENKKKKPQERSKGLPAISPSQVDMNDNSVPQGLFFQPASSLTLSASSPAIQLQQWAKSIASLGTWELKRANPTLSVAFYPRHLETQDNDMALKQLLLSQLYNYLRRLPEWEMVKSWELGNGSLLISFDSETNAKACEEQLKGVLGTEEFKLNETCVIS